MPDRANSGPSGELRAACFDFDGVIVDSEPLHYESERVVLAAHGIAFSVADKTKFVGGTVRGTVESICAHFGIGDVDGFYDERQATFDALVMSSLELLSGARAALGRLKDANIPMALVSSGERSYIEAALARHDLAGMFDFTVTQQDVARHKPDPEPYLKAASLLGVPPGECLAVEDSPTGVAAAKAAGLTCAAIPSPATAGADLSAADIRLGSLERFDGDFLFRLFGLPL
jgi:HAD superfamily hydrolase (TIGR01509 family)